MSQIIRTVPKERIENWNKILALKTALEDHPHDEVIEEFDIELFKGEQYVVTFKLVNGDKEAGPYLDVIFCDDGSEIQTLPAGHERLDKTYSLSDSYMCKEWDLKIQAALTTEMGVEIPVDDHGNPMHDAPGKYDQSARAMGAPTEHKPAIYPNKFSMNIKPVSMPGQVLLVVYKLPRSGKPNDENASLQMNEDLARYIVGLHETISTCRRCGSDIKNGLCKDETCPFSDHEQSCSVGWVGHDAHPEANEDTECDCVRKKRKT